MRQDLSLLIQKIMDDLHTLMDDLHTLRASFAEQEPENAIEPAERVFQKNIKLVPEQPVSQSAWQPPPEKSAGYGFLNAKTINLMPSKTQGNLKNRLRHTWLGQAYLKHLKPLPFVHKKCLWLWHFCHKAKICCVNFYLVKIKHKKSYSLLSLKSFVKTNKIPLYLLAENECVETPFPQVFPTKDQNYLASPHDHYEFPELFIARIENGLVYGGTNLIIAGNHAIHHDLYNFEYDSTSEELHNRILINLTNQHAQWILCDQHPESMPIAATFVDACAFNYAHWLTEVLPRIVLFCQDRRFKEVPLIVDHNLHPNIIMSLALAAGSERQVVMLPIGRAIEVGMLYVVSATGYVPFGRRAVESAQHSHGLFSPYAFQTLWSYLQPLIPSSANVAWPEKIFLRRTSGVRLLTNSAELEKLLVARGYTIVEPEKLTFLQQAQLFSQAKIIVGPTGAAFANIIFSPKHAKIFIFISKHSDICYWHWQNIACASGKTVCYILCDIDSARECGIHANFIVDFNDVLQELDKLL